MLPASPTPTWTQARARIAGLIARGAADDDPRVIQARADLVAARRASELDRAIDDPATLARAARIVATASPSPPPRTVTPMPREPAFNFHVRALRRLVTAAGPGLEPEVVDSVVLARTQHILRRDRRRRGRGGRRQLHPRRRRGRCSVTASRRRGYCKNKSCRALVLAEVLYEHDGLCESCAADQLELPIQAPPERGSAYGT